MDKLKMQTVNKADENFKKLAELFPNAVTESIDEATGEVVRAIDKDVLMQEISTKVVDGVEERYQFTWPDKKKSVLLANAPINKTLRPCREESVDFDTTENLYIEGDNLEVLKLLQETYLGKIKMIYIDPPYNTGNDFVYSDEFGMRSEEWDEVSGSYDEDGNQIVGKLERNTEANGRFHTDWLNMIYPRLKLAKDLLTDDGVIFISIDDNEVENLRKICDEIFGNTNFVENLIWKKMYGGKIDSKWFAHYHDCILVYAKEKDLWHPNLLPRSEESIARYKNPDNDPRGPWKAADFTGAGSTSTTYPITSPSGKVFYPPSGKHWVSSKTNYEKLLIDGRIWFGADGNSFPAIKRFLSEVKQGVPQISILDYSEVGHSDEANRQLKLLLGGNFFDYPKPVRLLRRLAYLGADKDSLVLDFFSGSATTAHAVMQLNAEDGGKRKFIMVQLPEETAEKSEAYKAGYKNICEIGKERIRRAGEKIRNEQLGIRNDNSSLQTSNSSLDIGFRVLKCDSSNMKDVYYNPAEFDPSLFDTAVDNIKEDRTPEDLLFQVMLDLGVLLSSKIEETTIGGKKVFNVADGFMIACFDENVTDEVITEIAKQKPYYFVMRDSSMANDSVATNFEQIFAAYSPETVRKVL